MIKIKADSVKYVEKLSDGSEVVTNLNLKDGYFVHDPSKEVEGTRYYYYKAVVDGVEYTSPIIRVTVNSENVDKFEAKITVE